MIILKESEFVGFINFHKGIKKNKKIPQKIDPFEKKLTYKLKFVVPMRFLIFELLVNLKLNTLFRGYDGYHGFDIMQLREIEDIRVFKDPFIGKKKFINQYYNLNYKTVGRVLISKLDNSITVEVCDKKYNDSLIKLSIRLTEYAKVKHTFAIFDRNEKIETYDLEKDIFKENDLFLNSKHFNNFKDKLKLREQEDYSGHDSYY